MQNARAGRGFFCATILLMELVPDTTNVVYIDEYPELKKRVFLRRLAQERAGELVATGLIIFPEQEFDDGA